MQSATPDFNLAGPQPRYTDGLPILEKKAEILGALANHQVIIVAGETGSGKTTQLPVMCLEAGRGVAGKIGCTQPRRIAATSIAARVSQELRCTLGCEVGYAIRFSDREGPQTCIKFMTDGILLAEVEHDRTFSAYDTLIIDEAHERSLNIDFLLGYLRQLLPARPDLKLIISSATIDTELFSKAFDNAPVIEVSGRLFPVELLYRTDETDSDEGESYVDQAVRAAQDLIDMYGTGDMLVFMPTERDIRETCSRLDKARVGDAAVLPLFSRLTRSEQERIFSGFDRRKIVVATNIAETSLTVPGIRFVVDTGLARIAQYAPRLRTNRLPVEPVSRASADQRKGRCGRVRDGVCVRLYSEDDYRGRDRFTLPEIKRSNLAGVVLTMMAHQLGTIEDFPFLEPPSKQATTDGYALLRELGALDRENRLTPLGREMARLPLDPNVARMILAARDEGALREVKIIAAALSIVDPRERPSDKQQEADAMHRRFVDPGSDFLTFVRLWDAYHEQMTRQATQNRMRRFCREHFLSFNRMREWHDVHSQLEQVLRHMRGFVDNKKPALPDAVHRALLTGLLSNCALRREKNRYRATRGRDVVLFPGSTLYGKDLEWVVCHEVVETSQVFARTVAPIKPGWLEELGAHLCTRNFDAARFDPSRGAVVATERVTLFGLPVAQRDAVRYGGVDPDGATKIFIREALVEEQLDGGFRFYDHNRSLRRDVEKAEAKLRTRSLFAGPEALVDFYSRRLHDVSSVADLNRVIREHKGDDYLLMSRQDLLAESIPDEVAGFPDRVRIGDKDFPLSYAFNPGADDDGVTLRVPREAASRIAGDTVGWIVPALWPARIEELLRRLPKDLRKRLSPAAAKSRELAAALEVGPRTFEVALSEAIAKLYAIDVTSDLLRSASTPGHLSLRIEVHDEKGHTIAAGRDPELLRSAAGTQADSPFGPLFASYERRGLTAWPPGDLPDHVEAARGEGLPLYGYPALRPAERSVDLVVCATREEADSIHCRGVAALLELSLEKELSWLERELSFGKELRVLSVPYGGEARLRSRLFDMIRRRYLDIQGNPPRTQNGFAELMTGVGARLGGAGYDAIAVLEQACGLVAEIDALLRRERRDALAAVRRELTEDLSRYRGALEELSMPFVLFRGYVRYLKAFRFRVSRAFVEPASYRQKRTDLRRYEQRLEKLRAAHKNPGNMTELELLVEEYAISLFAQQEVKTTVPVSPKRLDKAFAGFEAKKA